jgi:pimeloyl-ACP methyl ester carboxylesterase
MATYVLVHGAFGGGWEWTPVARQLRALGHQVFTPTLTGTGERAHLGSAQVVGLSTHVQDVAGLIEFEDLHDVILCGVGYGGVPITSAADRMATRIGLLVYIDGLVPYDGESTLDLLPEDFAGYVRANLDEFGESWRVPTLVDPLPPSGWQFEGQRAAHAARLREQPVMTLAEPIYLTSALEYVPRAYIRCTLRPDFAEPLETDPVRLMAWRAKANGWEYRELAAHHDPHLTEPVSTATELSLLAARVPERQPAERDSFPAQTVRLRTSLEAQNWAWN